MTRKEKEELYSKLVATNPKAELKGDTIPYTSMNGNMYSYLSKDDVLALRMAEGDRNEFMKKYKSCLMVAYGITQKEYVVVPDRLLKKTPELKHYFDRSFSYVSSLKGKQSKKRNK